MADDGSAETSNAQLWPLPKFYFEVKWGSDTMSFQEVSGLDIEVQPIEYQAGDSPAYGVIEMPGLKLSGPITMKKGRLAKDSKFWDWFTQNGLNTIKRIPISISLLDDTGAPTMVWSISNAWPSKITGTDLKADGNEVVVETIEITHDGVTIANG